MCVLIFNLKTAVRNGKVMQDFDSELVPAEEHIPQEVKGSSAGNDSGSKDCVNFPCPTAIFRLKRVLAVCICLVLDCYAMPSQVMIIRHAEKCDEGCMSGQLSPQGLRRTGALASFFTEIDPETTNGSLFENGLPEMLFGCRSVMDRNNNTTRCIQTLSTTAAALGLPIHSGFGYGQEEELVDFILRDPRCHGKNVLICWHHPTIRKIVQALGYPFPYDHYPKTRFDLVWFMKFPVPENPPLLVPLLQNLLYGDVDTLPSREST